MKHTNEEELFAYREGEMKRRETIAAHLQECGECRAELERMEEVFRALNVQCRCPILAKSTEREFGGRS